MTDRFIVKPSDLPGLECIAQVSSWAEGKVGWTVLGLFYSAGDSRPIVAVSYGVTTQDVPQGEAPVTLGFRYLRSGTIERALEWYDPSNLTEKLKGQVAGYDLRRDGSLLRPNGGAFVVQSPLDGLCRHLATRRGMRDAYEVPGPRGYPGPDRLTDALAWLYPDEEMAGSLLGRAMRTERDFGVGQRTVNNALAIERKLPGEMAAAPWVRPFVTALRHFDRASWLETIASRTVQPPAPASDAQPGQRKETDPDA